MANQEQLDILAKGVEAWNEWRRSNSQSSIDLSYARLSAVRLCGVNFWNLNLRNADLERAQLSGSFLLGVATLERRSKRQDIGVADLVRWELPLVIKVAGEADGSSWTMASAICSVQRMPERSIRSLIRFLHAPSTGPLAIGQPLREFVIAHAGAVSVKVIGDSPQRFARGPGQAAFGDILTNPPTTWPTSPSRIRKVRSRTQSSASRLPSASKT